MCYRSVLVTRQKANGVIDKNHLVIVDFLVVWLRLGLVFGLVFGDYESACWLQRTSSLPFFSDLPLTS